MNEEVGQEYLNLWEEIQTNLGAQRNLRNNITLIVGYMVVRIEKPDSFFWETCLNEMRKRKRTNLDRKDAMDAVI